MTTRTGTGTGSATSDAGAGMAAGLAGTAEMEDVFSDQSPADVIGAALAGLVADHPEVVVVSPDMAATVTLLRERNPERYFDVGIAENNSISVAAGLASCGLVPYVITWAPFGMIKCAEQIRTDLAATRMRVRLVTRMSGLAMGFFGPSHHAIEDIAIARAITNFTVTAPADNQATVALLRSTLDIDGPVLIRVSEGVTRPVYDRPPDIPYGRFVRLREDSDITIVATGVGVGCALDAATALEARGVSAAVLDAAYLKPFDEAAVLAAAAATPAILTVEEHTEVGGLGSGVAEVLARHGVATRLGILALPDRDLEVATPAALRERYGLTADGIVQRVTGLLGT